MSTGVARPIEPHVNPEGDPKVRSAGRGLPQLKGHWLAGLLIAAVFGLLLGYPLVGLIVRLFYHDGSFDGSAFSEAWHQAGLGQVLLNTVILVVAGGAVAIVLASGLAWLNERTNASLGKMSGFLTLAPLMVPPVAGVIGWTFLLSPESGYINVRIRAILGLHSTNGPFNIFSWYGIIITAGIYLMPYAYLPISSALRNVDSALEEASRISGASSFRTIWRVTIPAVAPAIASASVLVGIVGIALYAVPAILGPQANIQVLSSLIVQLLTFSYPPQTGAAVVLSLLVFVLVLIGVAFQTRIMRKGNFAKISGKSGPVSLVDLGRLKWPARILMAAVILCISVVPLVALVIVSLQPFWTPSFNYHQFQFQAYSQVFGANPVVQGALERSVELAIITATVGILFSLVMTLFARSSSARTNRFVSFLGALPASLSHIIVAAAFIVAFAGSPFNLSGTSTILFICFLIIYLPQAYFAVSSAVGQVGNELVDASSISGGRTLRTVRRVVMPLSVGGFISGWTLVVGLVMSDLTASVMLSGTSNPVVGYEVLDLYTNGSYSTLSALSVIVFAVTAAVLAAGQAVAHLPKGARAARGRR